MRIGGGISAIVPNYCRSQGYPFGERVPSLIVCHACDLVHRLDEIVSPARVRCVRCRAELVPTSSADIDVAIALAATRAGIIRAGERISVGRSRGEWHDARRDPARRRARFVSATVCGHRSSRCVYEFPRSACTDLDFPVRARAAARPARGSRSKYGCCAHSPRFGPGRWPKCSCWGRWSRS